jgi:DNA-binding transcriptional regulator GbsR (MarR family)
MDAESLGEELGRFADDVGLFYEELGFPRIWGRVLGWLLVCEPDLQTADDLAAALHASKGSISMATQALIRSGMAERQAVRGDRRTYYRIRPGAWTFVFERNMWTTTRLRELGERGLNLLNDVPDERRRRLEELNDLAMFSEREASAMLERWKAQHQAPSGEPH